MTPPLSNLRYEKKFVAQGLTLAEVLALVKRHRSAFREVYPSRLVNNIYLDSATRRDYREHVNGTADRSKTRVRWYGPQFDRAERPRLERKLKRGIVSGKESYPLSEITVDDARLASRLVTAFDTAGLPRMVRATLSHIEPSLINRYQRHYFVSGNGTCRLTVDCRLQYARPPCGSQRCLELSSPATTVVLEVKFGPEDAESMDIITNAFPFRMGRFSKYVTGIESL